MDQKIKPLGLVLCGGESSRMGVDKSLINYHGVTQREHVKKLLAPFCFPIVYSVGLKDEDVEEAFSDLAKYAGNGPVSGLLSLHHFFPDHPILLIGCDYPLITQSQIKALIPDPETEYDALCYASRSSMRPEPLLAWYAAAFCRRIREELEQQGSNSLRKFLEQAHIHTLTMDNPIHLTSADRPEDLSRVREIIQKGFDTFV